MAWGDTLLRESTNSFLRVVASFYCPREQAAERKELKELKELKDLDSADESDLSEDETGITNTTLNGIRHESVTLCRARKRGSSKSQDCN